MALSRFARRLVYATALLHVPVVLAGIGLLRQAGLEGVPATGGGVALAALGLGLFYLRAHDGYDEKIGAAKALRARLYHLHWCAAVFLFVASVVSLVVLPFTGFRFEYFSGSYALGLVFSAWGIFVRRKVFVIRRFDVPIEGLPAAFDGFRIAQLSDLHIGPHTPKEWGFEWVRAANAEAPDVAVVTGDLVTSGVAFHEDITEVVAGLRAKEGTYVSLGNHDYFGEGEPLISLLRARDVVVLRNEGRVLERDGERLFLAGVDDTWTKRAKIDATLRERPEGTMTVLLAHDPGLFEKAVALGVELTLSGHTHGGQVALPFFPEVSFGKLAHGYNLGFYRKGRATLYVHPGLGTTGPPIRLGVAPAITILTLRRGA